MRWFSLDMIRYRLLVHGVSEKCRWVRCALRSDLAVPLYRYDLGAWLKRSLRSE